MNTIPDFLIPCTKNNLKQIIAAADGYLSIKHLPRNCVQRVFLRWLKETCTCFEVPIRLTKITDQGLELHFINYPDCLFVSLSDSGIGVYVKWQDRQWDAILDLDAYICQVSDGFKCTLCIHDDGDAARLFPAREALWQDHLFEPFLKWVNEKLSHAVWLKIQPTCVFPMCQKTA